MYRPRRAKRGGWKRGLVALIITLNIIFTCVILWLVWLGRQEPGALIVSWFAFTTAELVTLATLAIKEGQHDIRPPDNSEH